VDDLFESLSTRFSQDPSAYWNALGYGVSLSLETPWCGESHRRTSDAWLPQVFTLAVKDCFSLIVLIVFEWIVCSKSVSVDGERLLLDTFGKSHTVDSSANFAEIAYR
jgi:hypothetical protein